MDTEFIKTLIEVAERISVVFLLLIIVVGSIREWWVPGWTYRKAVKDGDEYKSLLLQSLPMARQATQVAENVVRVLKTKENSGGS